ncbi:hypothetical protein [Psychroflexus tropicus]|uniref:hypothetical protein n=1 Tax=Psychroflexus tropicus TaxID=197345 RepID=UPI0003737B53|nr:hypothetical protein [Psychroflexus tropicus]
MLKDLVSTLVEENEKELDQYFIALKNNDTDLLAEIIHKLSSRFAQVNAHSTLDPKQLESLLREHPSKANIDRLQELYTFWLKVNEKIKEYLEHQAN